MRLNILTAVSRPENLPRIAESLAEAALRAPAVNVHWHWRFDTARRHVGGQALKNEMLEEVSDGWVWVLDDDTLAHKDILQLASSFSNRDAIVFSQLRTDGRVLSAHRDNVIPGSVDIGQGFLRRELIAEHRIPDDYNGDGLFLQAVLPGADVLYHPAVASLHNAISGVDVSA